MEKVLVVFYSCAGTSGFLMRMAPKPPDAATWRHGPSR